MSLVIVPCKRGLTRNESDSQRHGKIIFQKNNRDYFNEIHVIQIQSIIQLDNFIQLYRKALVSKTLLKVMSNSSSFDKENHNREGDLDTRSLLV